MGIRLRRSTQIASTAKIATRDSGYWVVKESTALFSGILVLRISPIEREIYDYLALARTTGWHSRCVALYRWHCIAFEWGVLDRWLSGGNVVAGGHCSDGVWVFLSSNSSCTSTLNAAQSSAKQPVRTKNKCRLRSSIVWAP